MRKNKKGRYIMYAIKKAIYCIGLRSKNFFFQKDRRDKAEVLLTSAGKEFQI